MQIQLPKVSRQDRLITVHTSSDNLRKINMKIAEINNIARATRSDVFLAPDVTDVIEVFSLDDETYHQIFLYSLDYGLLGALPTDNIVVFSKYDYAPVRTKRIKVGTPKHYRESDNLKNGILDPYDGTLTLEASGWASTITGDTVKGTISFVSFGEPWIFCGSHHQSKDELQQLWNHFRCEHGYSEATQIHDPDLFAAWLGIDFALTLDKKIDIELNHLHKHIYAQTNYRTSLWKGEGPIDSIVHVYYGPVRYEDVSGQIDTQDQFFNPNAGPRAWFTKKVGFEMQREYRFAVTTIGNPVRPEHFIAVSPELRALTSSYQHTEFE